jgi:GDP-4-dehydro-6-deoxy-D-mannose reductase
VRAYVTGGSGFVGGWLRSHLEECGDVVADPEIDVTDAEALTASVAQFQPEVVYHLAAISNVAESWADPAHTFVVNALGTLNLLEACRVVASPPRLLLVCSAEVYGAVQPGDLPINEEHPLRPVTPYAVSKVAAEYLGMQAYLAHRLPVVRVRAFNHVGPGQSPNFIVSSLARQIAEAERDGGEVLRVGNLTPRRDFTDVRDVVRAYRLLIERGVAGEVYNVCSGIDVAIGDLAQRMLSLAAVGLTVWSDPELVRAIEVPVLRGDSGRLRSVTGWAPAIALDETLAATLDDWRTRLARPVP